MNGLTRTFTMLAAVLLLAIPQLHATTTYSTSVTSASSLTISAATSGMTSSKFGVYLIDGNGVKRPTSEYSYGINATTYAVTINFSPAFTGTVKLKGLFAGSDTTHDYDFLLSRAQDVTGGFNVCDGCVDTSTGFAKRSYAGKHFVSTLKSSGVLDLGCNGAGVYTYILDNQLYFRVSDIACLSNVVNAKIATGVGYPTGSVPIGWINVYYGNLEYPHDDRVF